MRKEIDYCVAMRDKHLIMKKVVDEEKQIYTAYVWNFGKKDWVEAWDVACGYFAGYDDAFFLTEEEAMERIKESTAEYEELMKGKENSAE